MMRRYRKAALAMLLTVASLAAYAGYAANTHAAGAYGYPTSQQSLRSFTSLSQSLGAERSIGRPSYTGYYDGHTVTYLNTDVSNKAQAAQLHINYALALAAAKGSPAMYFVQGRAAANQVVVFGSEPGEKDYSPLWTETIVRWKAGAKPVLLTSDNQILALVHKGKVAIHTNGVILNSPIVSVGK